MTLQLATALDSTSWYIVRSSGWAALVLGVLALFLGFIFSARDTMGAKPAWWLDLHNHLGGTALAFTGIHMVAVTGDSMNGLGVVETLVPFAASSSTTGMALGVIAFWTFVAAVFTTWPKRWLPRNVWRWVHLSSVAGVALAGVHTWMVGTDAQSGIGKAILLVCTALFSYPFGVRVMKRLQSNSSKSQPKRNIYATR